MTRLSEPVDRFALCQGTIEIGDQPLVLGPQHSFFQGGGPKLYFSKTKLCRGSMFHLWVSKMP